MAAGFMAAGFMAAGCRLHINNKRGIVWFDGGVFSGRGTRRRNGHAGTATGFDIETNSTKPSSIESGMPAADPMPTKAAPTYLAHCASCRVAKHQQKSRPDPC